MPDGLIRRRGPRLGPACLPPGGGAQISPALIIVGALMLRTMREVNWDDVTEYLPAFLTMVTIPLAFSIADGIAMGFISYAFGKLVTGRWKQCPLIVYIFAALFIARYALAGQA